MKIAIIGYGASGLAVYCSLLAKLSEVDLSETPDLHIFDKSNANCRGSTYASDLDSSLILNMRASDMDQFDPAITSYDAWIDDISLKNSRYLIYKNQDHPPRKVFGEYLEHVQKCYQKKYPHSLNTTFYQTEVVDVIKERELYRVFFANNTSQIYDYVFLCIGNLEAHDMYHLSGSPHYFNKPWGENLPHALKQAETIGILGTGLTALDTVKYIASQCEHKKIFMASRRGLLPNTQGKYRPYVMRFLTKANIAALRKAGDCSLKNIIGLLNQELSIAYGKRVDVKEALHLDKSSLAWINQEIASSINCIKPWQLILHNLEHEVDDIWHGLDEKDKTDFLENYFSIWMSFKHSTPLQNSFIVSKMMEANQLKVIGGVRNVSYDEAAKKFSIQLDCCGGPERIEVDLIINATGSSRRLADFEGRLIKNMLQSGMIVSNGYGGIKMDREDMTILSHHNTRHNHFYCIGQLSFGVLFYTNALDMNIKQAKKCVECCIENIKLDLSLTQCCAL